MPDSSSGGDRPAGRRE